MTDPIRPAPATDAAEPPGGGRQDHDVMRDAAIRTVHGPASTDVLAAIGGLDVPGGEPHPELPAGSPKAPAAAAGEQGTPGPRPAHEPIPGERDPSTLTHREAGAVSGQFSGADIPAEAPHGWVDERTAREHVREGGGR